MSQCPNCEKYKKLARELDARNFGLAHETSVLQERLTDALKAERRVLDKDEVVQRLISAERRNRLMERILRDLAELEGEPGLNALVLVLQTRLMGAEKNIEKLTERPSS